MSTTQDAPVTTETRWLDAQQQVHWRAFLTGSAIVTAALSAQLEAESSLERLVRMTTLP